MRKYIKKYLYDCAMISQAPKKILLVSPDYFDYNKKTAKTNVFQHKVKDYTTRLSLLAKAEFRSLLNTLNKNQIEYYTFKSLPDTPDAVFPNNWFSTHAKGKLVLYPMYADNRRTERNMEIISFLKNNLDYNKVLDLTAYERYGYFLEGTGSMVLHHASSTVFACISARTHEVMVKLWCHIMNFNPVIFYAYDSATKTQIYHTNVLMSIATNYAIICMDCISNTKNKQLLLDKLEELNVKIIYISEQQMNCFCGNIIEVLNKNGKLITLMSESAYTGFTKQQLDIIAEKSEIVYVNIANIEKFGGGSLRCMIAGLH